MLVQLNGGFRMKEIKIGTSLFKDRRASGIYEKFSEYFTIEKESEYIEMLVITKEPSTELINAIMEYWVEIKEEENKLEEKKHQVVVEEEKLQTVKATRKAIKKEIEEESKK